MIFTWAQGGLFLKSSRGYFPQQYSCGHSFSSMTVHRLWRTVECVKHHERLFVGSRITVVIDTSFNSLPEAPKQKHNWCFCGELEFRPRIHIRQFTTTCSSSLSRTDGFFWLPMAPAYPLGGWGWGSLINPGGPVPGAPSQGLRRVATWNQIVCAKPAPGEAEAQISLSASTGCCLLANAILLLLLPTRLILLFAARQRALISFSQHFES